MKHHFLFLMFLCSMSLLSLFAQDKVTIPEREIGLDIDELMERTDQEKTESILTKLLNNDRLVNQILGTLIQQRCHRYSPHSWGGTMFLGLLTPLLDACTLASNQLVQLLHYRSKTLSNGINTRMILSDEVQDLLTKPELPGLIRSISRQLSLNREPASNNQVELFKEVYQHFGQQKTAALRFMAAFFQDTNNARHLQYMEAQLKENIAKQQQRQQQLSGKKVPQKLLPTSQGRETLNALAAVHQKMRQLQEYFLDHGQLPSHFKLYPTSALKLQSSDFQPAIYHYYVAAYSADQLKQRGFKAYEALMVPFLLHYLYEIIVTSDFRFDQWNSYLSAVGLKEVAIKSRYKIADLYLAYCGALYGINSQLSPIPWTQFYSMAQKNTGPLITEISKQALTQLKKLGITR